MNNYRSRKLPKNSLPVAHLMGSYYAKGKPTGYLEPLRNTFVIASLIENSHFNPEHNLLLATDDKGVLHSLNPKDLSLRSPIHDHPSLSRTLMLPPPDMVSFIKNASKENAGISYEWVDTLIQKLTDTSHPESIRSYALQKRHKKDIKPPDEKNIGKTYGTWYGGLDPDIPIFTYIVPRIRSLICIAHKSMPINFNKAIQVITPSQRPGEEESIEWFTNTGENGVAIGILSGSKQTLTDGIYKFQVIVDKDAAHISPNRFNNFITQESDENQQDNTQETEDDLTYSLSEMIRFKITNPAGEFDIISLNPITLEESLITQYARFYGHLLASEKYGTPSLKKDNPHDTKTKDSKMDSKAAVKSPGFKDYISNHEILRSKAELAAGIAQVDLGTPGQQKLLGDIAKALHDHSSKMQNEVVKDSLDAFFLVQDGKSAFADLYGARQGLLDSLPNYADWRNHLAPSLHAPINASDIDQHSNSLAGKVGIPLEAVKLFERATLVDDLRKNTVALSKNIFTHFTTTLPELKDSKEDYIRLAKSYFDLLSRHEVLASITLRYGFEFDEHAAYIPNKENEAVLSSKIEDIKKILQRTDKVVVEVVGHTCNIGSPEYNLVLSKKRAATIKKYLSEQGIPEDKISTLGLGAKSPSEPNNSRENRALNRRVVITAITTDKNEIPPSREGMGTLERYRAVALQKQIEKDKFPLKAAFQLTDIALGLLSVVPLTAPAARAIIAVKTAYSTSMSLVLKLDSLFYESGIQEYESEKKKIEALKLEGSANKRHFLEPFNALKDKDTVPDEIEWAGQFRVRAEVLQGLITLLIRASIRANENPEKSYEDYIRDYAIKEYIENFIMRDGWLYPKDGGAAFNLATYWLFAINSFNDQKEALGYDPKAVQYGLDTNNRALSNEEVKSIQESAEKMLSGTKDRPERYTGAHAYHLLHRPQARYVERHLTTDFQRYFPIHYCSELTDFSAFKQFANTFRPTIRHIKKTDIEYTRIYYQDDNNNWVPFITKKADAVSLPGRDISNSRSTRLAQPTTEPHIISPETPIRVLIVFKDQAEMPSAIPLRFETHRMDGINVSGPYYKALVQPLNDDDFVLPEEKQFRGKVGCVFYPFFQLWDKTHLGIKPLMGDEFFRLNTFFGVKRYYEWGNLTDMEYTVFCKIGDSSHLIPIPLMSVKTPQDTIYLNNKISTFVNDKIHVTLDANQPVQAAMLEEGFLRNRGSDFKYPELFKDEQRVQVSVKVGKQAPFISVLSDRVIQEDIKDTKKANNHLQISLEEEGTAIQFKGFKWEEPVEFLVTYSVQQLNTQKYMKKEGHDDIPKEDRHQVADWRVIPCHATLFTDMPDWYYPDSFKHKGPKLQSTMFFLGKLTMKTGALIKYSAAQVAITDTGDFAAPHLAPLYRLLTKVNSGSLTKAEQNKLLALFGNPKYNNSVFQGGIDNSWYIYAAHFKCSYHTPKGKLVHSLRPFGKNIFERAGKDEYIEYFLRDFGSGGLSGISVEKANAGRVTDRQLEEPRFNFAMPKSFTKEMIWTKKRNADEVAQFKEQNKDKYEWLTTPGLKEEEAKNWLDNEAQKLNDYKPMLFGPTHEEK